MREVCRVPFEVKSLSETDGGALSFEGYGSVFGTVDSYGDTIAKGAFVDSLKEWKAKGKLPKLLLQHGGGFFGGSVDDLVPVGKWTEMREDSHGLWMKGYLFNVDTDRQKATSAAMREGELDGLSIGFQTVKAERDEDKGTRTLTEVRLWEVSLVTFPANDPARVLAVKADGVLPSEREFERFLRDAGFSQKQAKTLIASGFRTLARDASAQNTEDIHRLLSALSQRAAILKG